MTTVIHAPQDGDYEASERESAADAGTGIPLTEELLSQFPEDYRSLLMSGFKETLKGGFYSFQDLCDLWNLPKFYLLGMCVKHDIPVHTKIHARATVYNYLDDNELPEYERTFKTNEYATGVVHELECQDIKKLDQKIARHKTERGQLKEYVEVSSVSPSHDDNHTGHAYVELDHPVHIRLDDLGLEGSSVYQIITERKKKLNYTTLLEQWKNNRHQSPSGGAAGVHGAPKTIFDTALRDEYLIMAFCVALLDCDNMTTLTKCSIKPFCEKAPKLLGKLYHYLENMPHLENLQKNGHIRQSYEPNTIQKALKPTAKIICERFVKQCESKKGDRQGHDLIDKQHRTAAMIDIMTEVMSREGGIKERKLIDLDDKFFK